MPLTWSVILLAIPHLECSEAIINHGLVELGPAATSKLPLQPKHRLSRSPPGYALGFSRSISLPDLCRTILPDRHRSPPAPTALFVVSVSITVFFWSSRSSPSPD